MRDIRWVLWLEKCGDDCTWNDGMGHPIVKAQAEWYCRRAIPLSDGEPFEYAMNACTPDRPHDWRCHWAVTP